MRIILLLFVGIVFFAGCEKSNDPVTKTITIVSTGEIDGTISNFNPRVFTDYFGGGQGKELRIGWELNGEAMRSFLDFDISEILPNSDQKLTIEKAYLKVYESNTNLTPFTAEGSRTVQAYLVDCGASVNGSDFEVPSMFDCGTIATTGYSVLTEHAVNVKNALNFLMKESENSATTMQFRLQFSGDNNVVFADPRAQSYFAIFSGNEEDTEYVPVLEIEYTIEDID